MRHRSPPFALLSQTPPVGDWAGAAGRLGREENLAIPHCTTRLALNYFGVRISRLAPAGGEPAILHGTVTANTFANTPGRHPEPDSGSIPRLIPAHGDRCKPRGQGGLGNGGVGGAMDPETRSGVTILWIRLERGTGGGNPLQRQSSITRPTSGQLGR